LVLAAAATRLTPLAPVGSTLVFLDVAAPPPTLVREFMWVVGDAQLLPFRDETFDVVIASHVIEHLEHPELFVREARRVLKCGGVLKLRTPNFLSRNARADPDHKNVFNVFRLRRQLVGEGFKAHLDVHAGGLTGKMSVMLSYLINLLVDELVVTATKHCGV